MKSRLLPLLILTLLLTACTFSLAEDITPPPNYVAPTPLPTLGPLYPAEAPNIENGAAIYAEKCVDCHGPAGMGDGPDGKQLPVTVAALGLPQVARAAAPSDWYTVVTRGNIERFMPPFVSLTDQERWDVVAYALTLHITPKEIKTGKELFETICADCPTEIFRNQEWMASISNEELAQWLLEGTPEFPAMKPKLTEGGIYEIVAYVRALSFAASLPTPEPVTATPTVAAAEATPATPAAESATPGAGTPSTEGTPAITETALPSTPEASGGKVIGSVSGENVKGLVVTLRGFDHASDSTGPQEILSLTAVTDAAGEYLFKGLEMPDGRIFIADVLYQGVTYGSEPVFVEAGANELVIPPFKVYETTTDFSALVFDQVHLFVEIADGTAQVIGVYTFSNMTETTIMVESSTEVPFLKMPADAQNVGFDLTQDSAPLLSTEGGFAIQPSDLPYGFVAFYTLPYDGKAQVAQPFALPATSVLVLVPDGIKVKSTQLTEGEVQSFQGSNFREYTGASLQSGETLTLDLSGTPKPASTSTETNTQQNLLIGIGALGAVLILAGVWMYLRDHNRLNDEELEEEGDDEIEAEEDILDAIIALDDLHRAGKIPDEAYQARRAELKARLKNT